MKKISACLLAIVMCSGPGSIGYADGWGESGLCNYRRYGLDAEKFFLYITQDRPYASWQTWPEKTKMQPGIEPHGAFHTTYVNPVAHRSIAKKEGMEFGSLIVMENFGPDKRLANITAKIKIKGYNPEGGDWCWFEYTPDGKTLSAGKEESCLACHEK